MVCIPHSLITQLAQGAREIIRLSLPAGWPSRAESLEAMNIKE
jgi:hypothetical protein